VKAGTQVFSNHEKHEKHERRSDAAVTALAKGLNARLRRAELIATLAPAA
jgi:hypothetical protein